MSLGMRPEETNPGLCLHYTFSKLTQVQPRANPPFEMG